MDHISSPSGLEICHRGPPLEQGPLPSFFYFALSAEESLGTDPFCQPVDALQNANIRCFSFTLPFHGAGHITNEAMSLWGGSLRDDNHFFESFLEKAKQYIDFLVDAGYIDPTKIAAGGLSRGGFIACQLAARDPRIKIILGYAPLTALSLMEEFRTHGITPLAESLSLVHQVKALVGRSLRFYIGNRDMRVGTEQCFRFIQALTEANYDAGQRSPPVEMIITPSIGHKGHGTAPEIFRAGAEWIKSLFA